MKRPLLPMFLVLHLMGLSIGGKNQVHGVTIMPLDMAPNSFDDQYNDCGPDMAKNLMDPTQSDFASQPKFVNIWKLSLSRWNQPQGSPDVPQNFDKSYGVAITAYTHKGELYKTFNKAVREGGESSEQYHCNFSFKSFHFLLTKAHQALKASCRTVYRGIHDLRFNVSDPQKPVRFGQFASSSLNKEVAERYGKDTFFTIETCLGVDISHFSFRPDNMEVLIPPYEVFSVVSYAKESSHIVLKSSGKHSNFNCGLKSGAASSSLTPGVPTSFLLWGFLLFSGAFLSMGRP